ncbi:hypothetical protein [Streptomyces chromofuscus]|uniref:Uncharacterized protein n=1 Tax=Streptomyces chromofuscus TaxID=42881 RepID=A0A7M2T389_STRCW|nr:hypothetical protein [Streptomyces chromofuscus]QOV41971.1 hypothetical protein IPT68_18990 [Streptomyces chromofuscus]GGS86777.1 hypothetical protein GCM10010254_03210 [Streptomyces chromofuscus]
MDGEGGDRNRDAERTGETGEGSDEERIAHLLGGLLIELGEKVRRAGPDGVRILTEDEMQQTNLRWYRTGWEEHARAVQTSEEHAAAAGHPADPDPLSAMASLLRFPQPPVPAAADPYAHLLPIVGAGDATVRELLPHRPRLGEPVRGREGLWGRRRGEGVEAVDADE